jgi:hypothetical protein
VAAIRLERGAAIDRGVEAITTRRTVLGGAVAADISGGMVTIDNSSSVTGNEPHTCVGPGAG